jgi:transmembrane sensor
MNSSQQHSDSMADERAALWAARLDGDTLDRAQRAELDAWLAQDPANRTLLSQYCQFSADLEEQVPALVAAGAVSIPDSAQLGRQAGRKWNFPRVAGAVLAAAAAIAVTVTVVRPSPRVENVAMASAQRGTRTLADGTRVVLNANTSLRFENAKEQRRITLAGGEALFVVAKDHARPFIVETPAGLVRVTGTTFNVRTDPSRAAFEVTVVEGSVRVRPGEPSDTGSSSPIVLGAGDQFATATGTRSLSATEVEDALAWRQGTVVFNDVPLREAAARFAHYHGCAIKVAAEVANERVGGRHDIDDLKGFLAGIELALPRVKRDDGLSGAVVLSLRPGS